MKVFEWNEIEQALESDFFHPFFKNGSGISIGSFDGFHKGHRLLISTLVKKSKELNILSGVVSFKEPLARLKHSDDYLGNLTTLNQRLNLFEQMQLDFVILVDFSEKFASIKGIEFLQMLVDACNMKYIAEGIDFRCGYKGSTDATSIKYFSENNNVKYDFLDPVFFTDRTGNNERISSSYIRTMVLKRFFSVVEELLLRPYSIQLKNDNNSYIFPIEEIFQVIPPVGIYHCKSNNQDVRVEITKTNIRCTFDSTYAEKLKSDKTDNFITIEFC